MFWSQAQSDMEMYNFSPVKTWSTGFQSGNNEPEMYFDEIVVTGCQIDNSLCSQWRKGPQNHNMVLFAFLGPICYVNHHRLLSIVT